MTKKKSGSKKGTEETKKNKNVNSKKKGGSKKNTAKNKTSAENKRTASKKQLSGFKKEQLEQALRFMYTSRQIDNKAMNLLRQGRTFFHIAGAGHEAVQVAFGMLLDSKKDWFFPYYRDIAINIAAGITPEEFFLQCFAKADDPSSGGRQLPCHWGHPDLNIPTQSSPTGTQFLQAVGTALAAVKRGDNSVTYVSSGEGTTSQGEFHEAVNWASREKLPVIFVIQNNKYAISVHVSQQTAGEGHSVAEMMRGYSNLKIMKIDGTDFRESYESAKEAIDYAKSGKGPVLMEADVVRLLSHSSSDDQRKYRDKKELEEEKARCPIDQLTRLLVSEKIMTEDEIDKIEKEVKDKVNDDADTAFKASDPDADSATTHIFDESGLADSFDYEKNEPDGDKIVMVDSINHAMHEEMERNDKVYVFGEDIADDKGGVFTATKGLSKKFGLERVFNSPLAEASIAGVAAGMALAGLKPVVEIQFGDYIWPAFQQMKNEHATIRYRSNNTWFCPVVTRVAVGGHIHGGLYHSQNIESIYAHIPGIYIAYPSNSADAKGLLKTAIRLNDPVLFCEHKGLYRHNGASTPEPDDEYLVPFGKARVVRKGTDLTVVTYGLTVWDAVDAARRLEKEGDYQIEIIDIRTIVPLDEHTIFNSVKKTNKVIVIHEDTLTGGFGAEIAARISDDCFQYLDGPVKRFAAEDSHIPYSPILENEVLPNKKKVYNAIKELLQF